MNCFQKALLSYCIKEMPALTKLTTKRTARLGRFNLGIMFKAHFEEKIYTLWTLHQTRRRASASVYFLNWLRLQMISEKDAEREGVNRRTGVISSARLLRACTASSTVAHLALCGWLPDFKYSAALAPRALTVCLLHFRILRWWVSGPLNRKAWQPYGDLKSAI